MTRDEHVKRILDCLFNETGLPPYGAFYDALRNVLFILIDKAIADGVRQVTYEQTLTTSRN